MSPLYMKDVFIQKEVTYVGMYIVLYTLSLKQSLIVIILLNTMEASYGIIYLII